MSLPEKFHEGATFERDDGAMARIDRVTDDQVYFVAWLPRHGMGYPKRMEHWLFLEAWKADMQGRCTIARDVAP